MPRPLEVAVLEVRGLRFDDWQSVMVQHRYGEPFAFFNFTAAEREPFPNRWIALRFRPGDPCLITLAGQTAIVGHILTRQVAYDARSHAVQLQGKSITNWAAKSSVDSRTGNFDEKNFEQIAREVLSYHTCGIKVVGNLDKTPFKRCQNQPGETVWDFLERLARVRGIVLGSDHLGNFVLIGDHDEPMTSDLIEGKNILRCQCIITKDPIYMRYTVDGSTAGDDSNNMSQAAEQEASVPGSAPIYSHRKVPAEQPVWGLPELYRRAQNESRVHESALIEAHITVTGWTKPNGQLWRIGEVLNVDSPMAALQRPLAIEVATFTQDRGSGTLTELKMVRPDRLLAGARYQVPDDEAAPNQPSGAQPAPEAQPADPTQVPLPPGTRLSPSGEIEEIPTRGQ